jgi:pimeloyl-ACP methyl ester carboxylesterase
VDGVILVSGVDPKAAAPGVPALVIQGRRAAMSGAARARAYATKANARYVELDAGHFALLTKSDEAERAIHDFVAPLAR